MSIVPVENDSIENRQDALVNALNGAGLGSDPVLPINETAKIPQPVNAQQSVGAEAYPILVAQLKQSKDYSEVSQVLNALTSTIKATANGELDKAADIMSTMKDANGIRLFENKEEALRFISRTRGLGGSRGLSRAELRRMRKNKNSKAIILNTVGKVLPPIVERDGRYYVDTHPLEYPF